MRDQPASVITHALTQGFIRSPHIFSLSTYSAGPWPGAAHVRQRLQVWERRADRERDHGNTEGGGTPARPLGPPAYSQDPQMPHAGEMHD